MSANQAIEQVHGSEEEEETGVEMGFDDATVESETCGPTEEEEEVGVCSGRCCEASFSCFASGTSCEE